MALEPHVQARHAHSDAAAEHPELPAIPHNGALRCVSGYGMRRLTRWPNVISMTVSRTRAELVLDAVLLELPRSRVTESRSVRVHDSWTEGDDVIFVLYAVPGIDALIGLRRCVSTGLPLEEEVDEIVNFEIGEPLGRYFNSALIVDGVFWWDGGPPTQFDWDQRREAAARLAARSMPRE